MSSDGTTHDINKYYMKPPYGFPDTYHATGFTTPDNDIRLWQGFEELLKKTEELINIGEELNKSKYYTPEQPITTVEKLRGVERAYYEKQEEDENRQKLFRFVDSMVSSLNRHKSTQPFSFINYDDEDFEIALRDSLNTILYAKLPNKFPEIKTRKFDYAYNKERGVLVIEVETNLGVATVALVSTNSQNSWKILSYRYEGMEDENTEMTIEGLKGGNNGNTNIGQ
jgi:hypothetical protein